MSGLIHYDDEGREVLDDTPVELPLQFKRPPSIEDMIRRAIRTEMSREAADKGFETFEDADDFQVDDDEDFVSPYELTEMQEESIVPTDASNLERQKGGLNEDRGNGRGTGSNTAVGGTVREDAKAPVVGQSVAGGREEGARVAGDLREGAK